MRRLIESLSPDSHPMAWKWVAGVFVFYLVVLVVATGAFVGHGPSRTHEAGEKTATNRSQAINDASLHEGQGAYR